MQPSSRSATPERSALGGRAGTLLGVRSAIPARIGSGHRGKLKSGAVVLMRPCAAPGVGRVRTRSRSHRSRMANADDCFARFDRGAIPRAGFIGQEADRPWAILGAGRGCAARLPPARLVRECPSPPPTPPPFPPRCPADPDLSGGKRGQDQACMGTAPCRAR